jgi:hypothetical protein
LFANKVQNTAEFYLDELNEHRRVKLGPKSANGRKKIYVSTFKDTNCKVIEFSDEKNADDRSS